MSIQIKINQHASGDEIKLEINDGKRGIIRLTATEAQDMADAVSFLRSDRSCR